MQIESRQNWVYKYELQINGEYVFIKKVTMCCNEMDYYWMNLKQNWKELMGSGVFIKSTGLIQVSIRKLCDGF